MPDNQEFLKRITARPDVFDGKPIIRGMRISAELALSQGAKTIRGGRIRISRPQAAQAG